MNAHDSLDRSIWFVTGETRLYPKLYRDGAYRIFVGPKSSDNVSIRGRDVFIQEVFREGRSARFAADPHQSGNRRSAVKGDVAGWDAAPEVVPLIEAALAEGRWSVARIKMTRQIPTIKDLIAKLQAKLASIGVTERSAMVSQRIGQDLFREAQLALWDRRCAVTDLDVEPILRASHTKPWHKCASPEEQLDHYNGFLFAPHVDALFDQGFLSFDAGGAAIWSECLSIAERERLGLPENLRLRWIDPRHQPYLDYHREFELRRRSGASSESAE